MLGRTSRPLVGTQRRNLHLVRLSATKTRRFIICRDVPDTMRRAKRIGSISAARQKLKRRVTGRLRTVIEILDAPRPALAHEAAALILHPAYWGGNLFASELPALRPFPDGAAASNGTAEEPRRDAAKRRL